jgi:iron-sulfur cluster insertion protein
MSAQFSSQLIDEVKVTPEAAVQLKAIIDNEESVNGIRIYVAGGGCGGMTYGMTFVEKPTDFDCVLEMDDGMNVYVDSVALGYLEGVEIDFRDEGVNKSFVFKNVFANSGGSGSCGGCGSAGGGGCG